MTLDELRTFAASAQCVCGRPGCVLAESDKQARAALLAALDVVEEVQRLSFSQVHAASPLLMGALDAFDRALSAPSPAGKEGK